MPYNWIYSGVVTIPLPATGAAIICAILGVQLIAELAMSLVWSMGREL